jgi:hypothetical protein
MKHAQAKYDRIQDLSGRIPNTEPVFLLRGQDIHNTCATCWSVWVKAY